jgi:hypothetical protein
MKIFIQILFFILPVTQICFTQTDQPNGSDNILSFVLEDFESEIFPPPGWILEYNGLLFWAHYRGASGYGVGTASAQFNFFLAPTGTTQSIVLASLGPTIAGDSLSFDHAYATYISEIDKLIIETSDDGGNTYNVLVTLNGGVSGPLVTAPPTTSLFVPTASQWATKKYALPFGTNRIRFKTVSAYGNNLYLDNCSIGTQFSIDVGAQSIEIPNPTLTLPQIPKAMIKNHGTTTQSFQVTMLISPGQYNSTKMATALNSNEVSEVLFDEWLPEVGLYDVTVFTNLAGDMDNSNDTVRSTIQANQPQSVQNINALYKDGQVFVTWDNLQTTNVVYTLYKSSFPIQYGYQLGTAQNLGDVRDNSGLNKRLTDIIGTATYLKIDSASAPLGSNKGLFVVTSTDNGSYYYAITTSVGGFEDTTILFGSNSLASSINETISMPRPVWQQNRTVSGKIFEIYVLYATKVTSSIYPQMTNAGTFPHNFAIVKSGTVTPHPLTIYLHGGGLHFLPTSTYFKTLGDPDEWVISIDEWLPTFEGSSYYYGFHEDYDVLTFMNPVPTSGILYNYTAKKIEFILDWAIHNLPVDSTRTYMTGWSMGAMGSLFNSIMLRNRIAALFIYAPSFDMASWSAGLLDRAWGTYQSNLLTNEGYTRNERLSSIYLLGVNRMNSVPLIFTFCGKNDYVVHWEEKPVFYDSISVFRHGGFHFWSMTDHQQTFLNSPWQPTFPNFSFFTRYRTNLSYPAFSNCSIDGDPGNGTPSNGDPIGTINGHLDWADDIIDETDRWEITLFVKDLLTTGGSITAPDSATTDVTLRRLQNFVVPSDSFIIWKNVRDGIVTQQGTFTYVEGLVTLQGVKVYKDSSRIIVIHSPSSIAEQMALPSQYALFQNYPNPFNPSTKIKYSVPQSSQVQIKVFDVLGNEIETLVNEEKPAGTYEITWYAEQLPSGVYFYQLKAGDYVNTKKMVLLK